MPYCATGKMHPGVKVLAKLYQEPDPGFCCSWWWHLGKERRNREFQAARHASATDPHRQGESCSVPPFAPLNYSTLSNTSAGGFYAELS